MIAPAAAEEGGAPIYFQDPDGKPSTAEVQEDRRLRLSRQPAGGRRLHEQSASAAAGGTGERDQYYRNPM